jgi:hypothetical protein
MSTTNHILIWDILTKSGSTQLQIWMQAKMLDYDVKIKYLLSP